jgi:adenylate cyclase
MKKLLSSKAVFTLCFLLLVSFVLSAKTDTLSFIGRVKKKDTTRSVNIVKTLTWNVHAKYKNGKTAEYVTANPYSLFKANDVVSVHLSTTFYVDTPVLNKLLSLRYTVKGSVKTILNGTTIISTGAFQKSGKANGLMVDEYMDIVFTERLQSMEITYLPYKANEFLFGISLYDKKLADEEVKEIVTDTNDSFSKGFYYLSFCIVFLILFFFLKERKEYLYFSMFCLFAALSLLWSQLQTDFLDKLEFFFTVFSFEFLSIFFCKVLENKDKSKIPLVAMLVILLISFLPIVRYSTQTFYGSSANWILFTIKIVFFLYVWTSVLYYLVRGFGQKRWEARVILIVCFVPIVIFTLLLIGIVFVFAVDAKKGFSNIFLPMLLEYLSTSIVYIYPLAAVFILGRRNGMNQRKLVAQVKSIQMLSDENLAKEKEKQELLERQKESLEKEVALRTQEVVAQKEEIEKQHGELKIEKEKSDDLLYNILPEEVANELKINGTTTARHYSNVTVLFTDFVNFTKAGEHMSAQGLIDELHACFKMFDEITSKYGIEKIKTIGDAYLAVCGLPTSDPNHAANVVLAATEINDFMQDRLAKFGSERTFAVRIGIHSGSVVAGIVGVKKFAYDIWGDTVNTAARMEQHGEAGRINISETTYNLVMDKFSCEYRGELEVKGKGVMKMYFVTVNSE